MRGLGGMGGIPKGTTTFKASGNGGNTGLNKIFKMFFSGNRMKIGGNMGIDNDDDFGFENFRGFSGFRNMRGFKNLKRRGNSQKSIKLFLILYNSIFCTYFISKMLKSKYCFLIYRLIKTI